MNYGGRWRHSKIHAKNLEQMTQKMWFSERPVGRKIGQGGLRWRRGQEQPSAVGCLCWVRRLSLRPAWAQSSLEHPHNWMRMPDLSLLSSLAGDRQALGSPWAIPLGLVPSACPRLMSLWIPWTLLCSWAGSSLCFWLPKCPSLVNQKPWVSRLLALLYYSV